jgi:hypothetical protein
MIVPIIVLIIVILVVIPVPIHLMKIVSHNSYLNHKRKQIILPILIDKSDHESTGPTIDNNQNMNHYNQPNF